MSSDPEQDLRTDGGDMPEYTPRRHLEGTLNNIQGRKTAVREIVGTNQKAPRQAIYYLQGYYDALELVEEEVRKAKDAEIMGVSPGDDDE